MQHVFVSYKHEDLDFAENVINRVEKAGYSTWTDDKLRAGEDWRAMIDIAIRNAFALIVIMTPEAKTSEYVTYEWAFAHGVGVKVVPLMLRPTPLHPRLEALQNLDFTNPKARPWDRLIEEIKDAANVPLTTTVNIPLNSPPYIRQSVMALDSPVESDRIAAIHTLQRVKRPEVQTVLIEALRHPIEDVRQSAAESLGKLGATSAIPALIELLRDPEIGVRKAAAEALGNLKDTAALPALAGRLKDLEVKELDSSYVYETEYKELVIAMAKLGDAIAFQKIVGALTEENDPYKNRFIFFMEDWEELGRIVGHLGDATLIPLLKNAVDELDSKPFADHRHRDALENALEAAIQMIEGHINRGKQ